jgi:hypothetical protein
VVVTNLLTDNLFPSNIHGLLRTISRAGFFDRSVMIGSWVMLVYQELYGMMDFSDVAELDGFAIRFPVPEAYFLHKLIIARKRQSGAKRGKDLEQCTVIMQIINDERMLQVTQAQRFGKETRRHIAASCDAIGFPLHRIGLS